MLPVKLAMTNMAAIHRITQTTAIDVARVTALSRSALAA